MGMDMFIGKAHKSEIADKDSFIEKFFNDKIKAVCHWRNKDEVHSFIIENSSEENYFERNIEKPVPIFLDLQQLKAVREIIAQECAEDINIPRIDEMIRSIETDADYVGFYIASF